MRRACECAVPDPVMQADGYFYCYTCSFQTGARPKCSASPAWCQICGKETSVYCEDCRRATTQENPDGSTDDFLAWARLRQWDSDDTGYLLRHIEAQVSHATGRRSDRVNDLSLTINEAQYLIALLKAQS